jgi:hypothetical protein
MEIRMRELAVLPLLIVLTGCPAQSGNDGGTTQDMTVHQDLPAAMCTKTCAPACAADEACAGLSATNSYAATCLKKCRTTTDCGAGQRCASLFNELGVPPVCVSDSVPALCPGVAYDPRFHCDFPQQTGCYDTNTLERTFSQPSNQTCGRELIGCSNGCEDGSVDAGTEAHCK